MPSLSNFATTFKSTVCVSGFSDNLSENEIKTTLKRIGTMSIFEIKNTDNSCQSQKNFNDEEVRASFEKTLSHHGDKALYRILIDYLFASYEERFGFDKLLWLADELAENNTLGYISRLTGLNSTAGITDTKIVKLDRDVFEAYIIEEILHNKDYTKSKNDYEAREKFHKNFPAYYIRLQQQQLNNNP
ncbi:hypothetical protein RCL_jg23297.t1 [Rhizophagus clarus]|uniref:Uncharacterized protein n=1 Tax=Rhizophagus clarus TaxID=94130 RepID=A0A8H3L144_9GLOM|nr:hypothetical protein RCL_jg23297.t1 [Rhizophagus clarus]